MRSWVHAQGLQFDNFKACYIHISHLSLLEEVDFFSFWFICLWFEGFLCFVLCWVWIGLFFLELLFLFSQGLFQSLYKLCCHQRKILTFCCPLNQHNKGLNLNLVLVQWNFCLTTKKVSAGMSLRVIVTGFQLCPLCLERILAIPICRHIHWLRISLTGHFLIGSWALFEVISFSSHCFITNCILSICYIGIYFLFPSTGCEEVQNQLYFLVRELSVSHTSAVITGLLLAIVCLILYSNSGLSSIISYSISWIKGNSNIL